MYIYIYIYYYYRTKHIRTHPRHLTSFVYACMCACTCMYVHTQCIHAYAEKWEMLHMIAVHMPFCRKQHDNTHNQSHVTSWVYACVLGVDCALFVPTRLCVGVYVYICECVGVRVICVRGCVSGFVLVAVARGVFIIRDAFICIYVHWYICMYICMYVLKKKMYLNTKRTDVYIYVYILYARYIFIYMRVYASYAMCWETHICKSKMYWYTYMYIHYTQNALIYIRVYTLYAIFLCICMGLLDVLMYI